MGLNRTERAMSGSKLIACAFVAASLCGCFSSSSYTPELVFVSGFGFNAVPTGTSRVTVSGYFFTTSTTIYWNGRKQVTTYQGVESASAMQLLQVDLDTEATKVAGTAQVTATNEGSFLSAPLSVRIFDAVLALTAISPQQASLGAPATTLTVSGTGFRPASGRRAWNSRADTHSCAPRKLSNKTSRSESCEASFKQTGPMFYWAEEVAPHSPLI